MKPKVYHYAKCSTCRKALAYLAKRGVEIDLVDIVQKPPSPKELRDALRKGGLTIKQLFNTSGQSYREGRFSEKLPAMSDADALAALAADGKLVKRPLLLGADVALVGFDERAYKSRFG